ncbi:MAG: hypothetical protein E6J20_17960 [Chloroflexi bacterium]|nr:MAG: hypothetical protein E6J20_17960 [Chloroflexota bacterium]
MKRRRSELTRYLSAGEALALNSLKEPASKDKPVGAIDAGEHLHDHAGLAKRELSLKYKPRMPPSRNGLKPLVFLVG